MSFLAKFLGRADPAPLVSIVVASYNHAPFVQDCLRSVLEQGVDSLEIVVTDDGSTDGTAAQVAQVRDPRVRLHVFPENRGACHALNNAIHRSRGRYIAVLNSDDLFLPGKLRCQIDYLEGHPGVGAVFGWPSFINEQGQPFSDPAHKDHAVFNVENRNRHQWLRYFFDHGNALCHPTAMLRREVYQCAGLYDPRLAQVPDLDQWIRVCMRYDIHVMPLAMTAFRIRERQQNASAARPEVIIRDAWERAVILRHYLRLPNAELHQVFPEFRGLPGTSAEQLAGHALGRPYPFHHRFALDAWHDALPDGGQLDPRHPAQDGADPAACRRFITATGAHDLHHLYN